MMGYNITVPQKNYYEINTPEEPFLQLIMMKIELGDKEIEVNHELYQQQKKHRSINSYRVNGYIRVMFKEYCNHRPYSHEHGIYSNLCSKDGQIEMVKAVLLDVFS